MPNFNALTPIFSCLPQYIVENAGESLLPRYLDMYRITVHDKDTYLIIMNNIMSSPLEIHRVYDLKVSVGPFSRGGLFLRKTGAKAYNRHSRILGFHSRATCQ